MQNLQEELVELGILIPLSHISKFPFHLNGALLFALNPSSLIF
jgi:hypothetical protein